MPLGSGRVGSDDLGYGPGSGFSFEPVQAVRTQFANCVGPQIFLSGLWQPWWNLSNIQGKYKKKTKVECLTPHFTVSVSLWCPQGTVLPTLPPRLLQGTAVSGERLSQGPPRNVVALGFPPPPGRVSERSVQMLPVGSQFQDVVLTAQLHIHPETSL